MKKVLSLKDFNIGTRVVWFSDNPIDTFRREGIVTKVFDDHIIIDVPKISDHIYFDKDCLENIKIID